MPPSAVVSVIMVAIAVVIVSHPLGGQALWCDPTKGWHLVNSCWSLHQLLIILEIVNAVNHIVGLKLNSSACSPPVIKERKPQGDTKGLPRIKAIRGGTP